MDNKIIEVAYLSLSLGLSRSQIQDQHGTYANWIRKTNQYIEIQRYIKQNQLPIGDVYDDYDFVDSIKLSENKSDLAETLLVDICFGHSDRRTKLNSLIEYAKNSSNTILLHVYDITLLGSSPRMIIENYTNLLDAGVYIKFIDGEKFENKELATALDVSCLLDFDIAEKTQKIKELNISPRSTNWSGKNFKKHLTPNFYDAYFLYQCFLIGDEEAYALSCMSKKSFPQKSFEFEQIPSAIVLGADFPVGFSSTEFNWFLKYPKMDYSNLPRRCGKLAKDYLLLINGMSLPIEALEAITISDLEKVDCGDFVKAITRDDVANEAFYKKSEFLSERFNLPRITPDLFYRYCLRHLAALNKEYTTYYKRKDENLCAAIMKFTTSPEIQSLSVEDRQAKYDAFFSEYYYNNMQ